MRKHFAKPALSRFEIRLNENIALSWKYYQENNLLTTAYNFTHMVGTSTSPVENGGCYDYYSGTKTLLWSTTPGGSYDQWFNYEQSYYTDQNSVFTMTAWLSYVSKAGASVCYAGTSH